MSDCAESLKFYRIATENEWLFADDTVGECAGGSFTGDIAREGNLVFQVLTDTYLTADTPYSLQVEGANGIAVTLYQLIPAHVRKNSAPHNGYGITTDYEQVRDFVTKKAPFDVYDGTALPENGKLYAGRAAFAIRLTAYSMTPVGQEDFTVTVTAGDLCLKIPVRLTVHAARIPALSASKLKVSNWTALDSIVASYKVDAFSDDFYTVYRRLLVHQLDIRSNQLQVLPASSMLGGAEAIRDENGTVVDFDFSKTEKLYQIGREMGFTWLISPFVARWKVWTDPEIYINWENDLEVTEREAYRQLRIYFTRLEEMIERNGWKDCWLQSLVDEPQMANSQSYRILAGICRRFMPGVTIHDPVESTDIAGAPDIWCVKQAVFEKYIDIFRSYQAMGEHLTFYTCGFPSGDMMNRVMDLPLFVGRLAFWMCHRYGLEGFLHWGYHTRGSFEDALGTAERYPAGNSYLVYPWGSYDVCDSIRAHNQRAGAEDWELLAIIMEHDPETAQKLIERGCRTFDDYEKDPAVIEAIRLDILREADKYAGI